MKAIARISTTIIFSLVWMAGAAQAIRYTVQIEALPALDDAQERVTRLKSQGIDAYIVKGQALNKWTIYRVRVGKFPSKDEARKFGTDLQKRGVVRQFFIAVFERPEEKLNPPAKDHNSAIEKIAPATPAKAQNQSANSPKTSFSAPRPTPDTLVQEKGRESRSIAPIETPASKRRKAREITPAGASAICRDGTYSYSQNRRGTCSHHGGVARWLY